MTDRAERIARLRAAHRHDEVRRLRVRAGVTLAIGCTVAMVALDGPGAAERIASGLDTVYVESVPSLEFAHTWAVTIRGWAPRLLPDGFAAVAIAVLAVMATGWLVVRLAMTRAFAVPDDAHDRTLSRVAAALLVAAVPVLPGFVFLVAASVAGLVADVVGAVVAAVFTVLLVVAVALIAVSLGAVAFGPVLQVVMGMIGLLTGETKRRR